MCIITYYYYYYKYSNFIIFNLGTNFIYNISNEQFLKKIVSNPNFDSISFQIKKYLPYLGLHNAHWP